MKPSIRRLATVAAVSTLFCSGLAQAESQYGYDPAGGAGARTATARVTITVNTPKLILLRIGASAAGAEAVTLNNGIAGAIPGGAITPGAATNNAVADWDGTAPSFAGATAGAVRAYAWTNALNGGSLTGAITTAFAGTTGVTDAMIDVASTTVSDSSTPATVLGNSGTKEMTATTAPPKMATPPISGIGVLCSLRCAGASTKPMRMARRRTQGMLSAVTDRAMRKMARTVCIA